MEKIIFLDRDKELAFLEKNYLDGNASLVVIYGRRRVGKSELIKHFAEGKRHIYYLSDKRGTEANVHEMARISSEFFKDVEPNVTDFYGLFKYIAARNSGERLIVAVDEFPYLVVKDDSIPSVFQKIVDETIPDTNILLILSGSSISMMHETALSYKAPLYGRRAGAFELLPMGFGEVLEYMRPGAADKAVEAFAFFGNMPAYFTKVDRNHSIEEELKTKVMTKGARFYMEPEILLQEELKDPSTYKGILQAMAHSAKLSEIASKAGIEAKDMPKYLKVLMDLRIVRKETPITLKKSKKTIYMINDGLFLFWFGACSANMSYLEDGKVDFVYDSFVRPRFKNTVAHAFEQVCAEALKERCPFPAGAIGRWWGKDPGKPRGENDEEIDILAINEETKDILFAECKWTNGKVEPEVYYDLRRKAQLVQWNNNTRKERYALFSKEGFTEDMIEISKKEKVLLFSFKKHGAAEAGASGFFRGA